MSVGAALSTRLQLIYDNIVGLATAGVVSALQQPPRKAAASTPSKKVTVLPSAEELAEGLAHLGSELRYFSPRAVVRVMRV